ncbi:MAG: glycosyl hydrolase family 18 protein, partial [Chitinophagaceae bacterium]
MKRIFLKRILLIIFLFSYHFIKVHGQLFSDHYQEVVRQQSLQNYPIPKWDSLRCAWYGECPVLYAGTKILNANACPLNKIMFGWHAGGTSPSSYVWQSLSDLSFFSYQVNPATGAPLNPTLIAGWGNDAAVVTAKNNGVRVNLCATLFQSTNQFSTFFGSPAAQSTLITNLINEVLNVGANGINIDFEGPGLNTTYLTQFSSFMSTLSTQLHAAVPNSVLSFDLQGSTSSSSALLTALNPSVDLMIMMGYDYYWAGQFYPGPIAPTYQFTKATSDLNGHGNVSNDLNNVLKYIPASKVVLAMPYYGRRWKVTNGCTLPGIGTQATISTVTNTLFRQNANGY